MATKRNKTGMISAINAGIVDNTTGLITPAILRGILLDICESLLFGTRTEERAKAITYTEAAPVSVHFPAPFGAGITPALYFRAYDSDGNQVGAQITELTNSGFKILPADTCLLDYTAITNEV